MRSFRALNIFFACTIKKDNRAAAVDTGFSESQGRPVHILLRALPEIGAAGDKA
jgi:hypothetical protein